MKINFAGPANTTVRNKICSIEIFLQNLMINLNVEIWKFVNFFWPLISNIFTQSQCFDKILKYQHTVELKQRNNNN